MLIDQNTAFACTSSFLAKHVADLPRRRRWQTSFKEDYYYGHLRLRMTLVSEILLERLIEIFRRNSWIRFTAFPCDQKLIVELNFHTCSAQNVHKNDVSTKHDYN